MPQAVTNRELGRRERPGLWVDGPLGHRLPSPTATCADEVHLHIGLDAFGRALDVRDPLIDIRDTRRMHPSTPQLGPRVPSVVSIIASVSLAGHRLIIPGDPLSLEQLGMCSAARVLPHMAPGAAARRRPVPRHDRSRSEWLLSQPKRGSLRVLADSPALPGVDDASAERLHPPQRFADIAHCEVGQRKRISRSASARMNTDRRVVRVGLPPLSLSILARLQLNSQKSRPETTGAQGIVCGELDRGQRGVRHCSHDSRRTSRNDLSSTTQVQSAGRPIGFRIWRG